MRNALPVYDERTIRQAGSPDQYQRVQADPAAFGALQGRAAEQAGQTITQLGGKALDVAQFEQERANADKVMATTAEATHRTNKLLYENDVDPTTGEVTRKGLFNRVGFENKTNGQDYEKHWQDEFARVDASTDLSDAAKRVVKQKLTAAKLAAEDSVMRQSAKGVEQATVQALQTGNQAAANAMTLGYTDPKILAENEQTIRTNTASAMHGSDPNAIKTAAEEQVSKAYLAVVDRVRTEDPLKANALKDKLIADGKLQGPEIIQLEKALRPAVIDEKGRNNAAAFIGSASPAGQLAAVMRAGLESDPANPWKRSVDANGKPVGAQGPMQIMPGTAKDISKNIMQDGLITPAMSDDQVEQVFKANPGLNERYGEALISHLTQKYHGDMAAVMVAYNAGPGVANKWLAAGKDMSILPDETRHYITDRLAAAQERLASTGAGVPKIQVTQNLPNLPPAGTKLTRDQWPADAIYKPADLLPPRGQDGDWMDARAFTMAETLAKRFAEKYPGVKVPVNDAHEFGGEATAGRRRGKASPEDNPHVGNSQHLKGTAFDFQIQSLSQDQKRDFLAIAKEVGFGGYGFYGENGHLHLDSRQNPAQWGSVPAWAAAFQRPTATLGQGVVQVPATLNGLPVPFSMAIGASGNANPTAAPIAQLLQKRINEPLPAFQTLNPAQDPIPTVTTSLRTAAVDYASAMQRAEQISDPQERQATLKYIREEMSQKETTRKLQTTEVKIKAMRGLNGGQTLENALSPEEYINLQEQDPVAYSTLKATEERIAKKERKTNFAVYNHLEQATDEELAGIEHIEQYQPYLDDKHFDRVIERYNKVKQGQNTAARGAANLDDKGFKEVVNSSLAAALGEPTSKQKQDPAYMERQGMFRSRMQDFYDQAMREGKGVVDPKAIQAEAQRLLQPVDTGIFGSKKYLFEYGTLEENRRRLENGMEPVGGNIDVLKTVRKPEEIPAFEQVGPVIGTYIMQMTGRSGKVPPADIVTTYNNLMTAASGRPVAPTGPDGQVFAANTTGRFRAAGLEINDKMLADLYAKHLIKSMQLVSSGGRVPNLRAPAAPVVTTPPRGDIPWSVPPAY